MAPLSAAISIVATFIPCSTALSAFASTISSTDVSKLLINDVKLSESLVKVELDDLSHLLFDDKKLLLSFPSPPRSSIAKSFPWPCFFLPMELTKKLLFLLPENENALTIGVAHIIAATAGVRTILMMDLERKVHVLIPRTQSEPSSRLFVCFMSLFLGQFSLH